MSIAKRCDITGQYYDIEQEAGRDIKIEYMGKSIDISPTLYDEVAKILHLQKEEKKPETVFDVADKIPKPLSIEKTTADTTKKIKRWTTLEVNILRTYYKYGMTQEEKEFLCNKLQRKWSTIQTYASLKKIAKQNFTGNRAGKKYMHKKTPEIPGVVVSHGKYMCDACGAMPVENKGDYCEVCAKLCEVVPQSN